MTKDKDNKDARETVNKLMVTEEQAKESVRLKVLHDKKIYENEKLGINDYKMNPHTKTTKADIKRFEKDKGIREGMNREEVLEDDVKTLSLIKSGEKPPSVEIFPYWNHRGRIKQMGTRHVKIVLINTSVIHVNFRAYVKRSARSCGRNPKFADLTLSQVGDTHRILRLHAKRDERMNITCISLQHFQI